MSALANKNPQQAGNALPKLLPSTLLSTQWLADTELTRKYNFSCSAFASLASKESLKEFLPHLIEIDIRDELALLSDESMFEITVPVYGINDLLSDKFANKSLNFAGVMALNGFGAKGTDDAQNNFPRPDYVRVTDIVGNQYEIMVNQDGKIELPENGTGLFSLPKALTFIYNKHQIVDGFGFEDMTANGIKKNKIYLLPPTHTLESFAPYICVTHLSEDHRRIVDSIRRVSVKFDELPLTLTKQQSKATREPGMAELLFVDVSVSTSHQAFGGAFNLSVTLEPITGVDYSPKNLIKSGPIETHGWRQHPILANIFTKHFGLSKSALKQLIKQIYSEFDFMRDCLQGDTFSLSVKKGYNQFLIHPQAFPICYDLLVHDLICHKIPGSFLMERVADERLIDLKLEDFNVGFHDSVVLEALQEEFKGFRFHRLCDLFLKDELAANEVELSDEYFYVYAQGLKKDAPEPNVTVDITHGKMFSKNLITAIEAGSQDKVQHSADSKGKEKGKPSENKELGIDEIFDTNLPTDYDDGLSKEFSNVKDENKDEKAVISEGAVRYQAHERRKYTPSLVPSDPIKSKVKKTAKKPSGPLKRPPQP